MTLSNEIISAIEDVSEFKNLHKNDRVAAIGAISFALKNEAVMKAILASVKCEEWVDVNDRLPYESDGGENGYVQVYYRTDRQHCFPTCFGYAKYHRVKKTKHTHWKHITPPKTK